MSPSDNGYEKFLAQVQPFSVDLTSSSASLDRRIFWKLREGKKHTPTQELMARYGVEHIAGELFDVRAEFKVTIFEPGTKKRVLLVQCVFDAHFHAEKPINKEYVARFAESEFRVVVWPYVRQFVSDTTARMGIPPLFLPISLRRAALRQS